MLKIEHLTKYFKNKCILNNVSFTVQKGEIAVFLGSSGVGKSALLRILNNLDTPNAGTITIDKHSINDTTSNTHLLIGMVFQHFNLFEHITIEHNITLPLQKVLRYTAQQAQDTAHILLHKYGLVDKKKSYVHCLSGGQKQRLAIARAIAMKPTVICFDEPTSALDPVLTSSVAQHIQQLAAQNYIVLVATHDTTLIEKLQCTLHLMHNGSIIESTSSENFLKNPEHFPHLKKFIAGHE